MVEISERVGRKLTHVGRVTGDVTMNWRDVDGDRTVVGRSFGKICFSADEAVRSLDNQTHDIRIVYLSRIRVAKSSRVWGIWNESYIVLVVVLNLIG